MQDFWIWLESTGLARTVGESSRITAWLSAAHVIGFTLVMSGALASNLRAAGVLLTGAPVRSIARPAMRVLIAGLAISLPTGFLLLAPRASYTVIGGAFQLKMGLLLLAASFQFAVNARLWRAESSAQTWLRAGGVLGAVLWLSLAAAACWFILFE
jgi:hypothetical protein